MEKEIKKTVEETAEEEKKLSNIERYNLRVGKEVVRQNQSKGGFNAAKSKRKAKTFKESLSFFLSLELDKPEVLSLLEKKGIDVEFLRNVQGFFKTNDDNNAPELATVRDGVSLQLIVNSLNGDLPSITALRDSTGEKPSTGLDINDGRPLQAREMAKVSEDDLLKTAGFDE